MSWAPSTPTITHMADRSSVSPSVSTSRNGAADTTGTRASKRPSEGDMVIVHWKETETLDKKENFDVAQLWKQNDNGGWKVQWFNTSDVDENTKRLDEPYFPCWKTKKGKANEKRSWNKPGKIYEPFRVDVTNEDMRFEPFKLVKNNETTFLLPENIKSQLKTAYPNRF